ncbi:GON-4-like protein [Empidonax traillii]|uniref:GON-4-like protein n=1 Tax=Empidonax traillii TaxID=164674 RepID=UPI000FFD1199|nr:GON-4-like protein [Empidonax traillii]
MKKSSLKPPQEAEKSKPPNEKPLQSLVLDSAQRKRLQQQMQQHVQLLTQIHLLASCNPALSSEAGTTRMFLNELGNFARSSTLLRLPLQPKFQTMFQPCNLQGALRLVEDFHARVPVDCSPRKAVKKSNASEFSCLPKQLAWIFATRRVFMYPELLPICSLRANPPRDKIVFTKAEDNLLALGLKHFEGTEFPKPLISKYLLPTKTAHQLTVRIKNLNMNRAPDNIVRYYKKTKQLPVLVKCCEEIQPHEWKAPVEREEHRLPFWLKASLPSIQGELKQLAGDAKEMPASPAAESALLGAAKEAPDTDQDEKYPLLMPKGLVLTLKPLANRFSRRAWRRQRSSALKPVLIRPNPGVQPGSGSSATNTQKPGKCPQAEAPPSKVLLQVPRPVPVMPAVPAVQPLGVPAVLGGGDGLEFQKVLPAAPPDPRPAFSAAVPPALVSPDPAAFQPKLMLPALAGPKSRRPCVRKGCQRKKGSKAAPLMEASALIQPSPVILTVPAATVKVVNIGNVIQPLGAAVGRGPQAIPVTTLLVNPAPFPCPLNQPLVTSSIPSLLVSPSPVGLSGPPAGGEAEERLPLGGYPAGEPKAEPPELFVPCSSLCPEEEQQQQKEEEEEKQKQQRGPESSPRRGEAGDGDGSSAEPRGGEAGEAAKTHPEEPDGAPGEGKAGQKRDVPPTQPKEEFLLGLGQELNVEAVDPKGDRAEEEEEEEERKGEEEGRALQSPPQGDMVVSGPPGSGESPRDPPCPAEGEPEFSSPPGRPEDSSSVDGQSVGTPAGPEAAGDREGQEEEEEDDFDDFTQDEDEEMSSASEESVLSVPELQETMEKLTWLATERRLSQEGDSEEENSQEENSEPEEEEEEEGEGIESSQKDDETCGDASEEPKSAFTSAKAASPQVETHRIPAGENLKAPGKGRSSHRTRNKRGRARGSKDTSKLLLLYDEDILERDPLREQKDLAFAQAYLTRVRETLQHIPGKYEDFLRVIYEFEISTGKRTAVDLYSTLQKLLHDWPQLLTDFAAFLLPEQALECGLFEEQQAFEKSRKFLRQLEICFAENPAHHQKIIKVLQSCADCLPQEIAELKTQMWQLLKGHDHLQDEFSVFFDHLRPSASRMGDFEEINWTEEKEYEVPQPLSPGQEGIVFFAAQGGGSPLEGKAAPSRQGGGDKAAPPDAQVAGGAGAGTARDRDSAATAPRWAQLPKAAPKLPQETKDAAGSEGLDQQPRGNGDVNPRDLLVPPPKGTLGPPSCRAQSEGAPPPDPAERLRGPGPASGAGGEGLEGPPLEGKAGARQSWVPTGGKAPAGRGGRSSEGTACAADGPPEGRTKANSCLQGHQHPEQPRVGPACLGHREEEQQQQQKVTEATVCAKNSKVSSTGEKVVLWTREADRVILTTCQEKGAHLDTFHAISQKLGNKTASEVSHRFRELMRLFHTSCDGSSEDEEDATSTSNTDQLSDKDLLLSEEEPDD